jgi:hypothetical protein
MIAAEIHGVISVVERDQRNERVYIPSLGRKLWIIVWPHEELSGRMDDVDLHDGDSLSKSSNSDTILIIRGTMRLRWHLEAPADVRY